MYELEAFEIVDLPQELIDCGREDIVLHEQMIIEQKLADALNDEWEEHLPPFTEVAYDPGTGDWRIMPMVECARECLPVFNDLADADDCEDLQILVVNDHGNVSYLEWHPVREEYVTVWAVV